MARLLVLISRFAFLISGQRPLACVTAKCLAKTASTAKSRPMYGRAMFTIVLFTTARNTTLESNARTAFWLKEGDFGTYC